MRHLKDNQSYRFTALVDEGAQINLVSQRVVDLLQLPTSEMTSSVGLEIANDSPDST